MPLQSGTLLQDRYRIESELARGGFGAVYLALDENLNRHRAVKENLAASRAAERQFRREAKLLATLSHPHLPRVTDHFILDGNQYLVMDYVEGDDLSKRLEQGEPLDYSEILRWVHEIAGALEYMHSRDPPIIHRDIKPANIKVNLRNEAVLVDFGIAKEAHKGQETSTGARGITPGFAPPEQYDLGHTDARTDVYALGATAYNLLSGHAPPDSVERLIGAIELPPLATLRPDLPRNVGHAIERAMQVHAEDRFQSIAEFRQALADPDFGPGPTAEIGSAADAPPRRVPLRRLAWPVLGLAITFAALALFAVNVLESLTSFGDTIQLAIPRIGPFAALPTIDVSTRVPETRTPTATSTSTPTATATPRPVEIDRLNAHGWRLYGSWQQGEGSVPFSMNRDGSRLALISRQGVDIFNTVTGMLEGELQGFLVGRAARALEYLDDSILVLLDDEILHYSLETKNLIRQMRISGREMLVSPNYERLAVRDEYVSLLDLEADQLLATLGTEGVDRDFAFSPDGRYFALSAGDDVELYRADIGLLERTLQGHGEAVRGLQFSDDSALLAAASGDIWEVASGELVTVFDSATAYAALSPNAELLVGEDGWVWDIATGERVSIIPFASDRAEKLEFTADGEYLVRQDRDGGIELWTADPHIQLPEQQEGAGLPEGVAITPLNISKLVHIGEISGTQSEVLISPDWSTAITWSPGSRDIALIDLQGSQLIGAIRSTSDIRDVDYLGPDYLIIVNTRGTERWDLWTQRRMQQYEYEGAKLINSPGGEYIAVQDEYIQVVDPVTGDRLHNLGSADSGQDFQFAPHGDELAIAAGPSVGLWDMETGRRVRQFSGHGPQARDLQFTPDGSLLLSGSGDLWEVETGERIAAFDSNTARLAISPDGSLIAGTDGALWDARSGQYLGTLDQDAERVWFTPSNAQILYSNRLGDVSIFGIAPGTAESPAGPIPSSQVQLRRLDESSARDLAVLGWWGDDPLFDARMTNDRGVNPFGMERFKDVALSPHGGSLTALTEREVRVLRPEDGQLIETYDYFLNPEAIREIAYLGDALLLLKDQAGVEQWDLKDQRLVARFDVEGEELVTSPDGRHFAIRSGARVLALDSLSGEEMLNLPASESYVFSPAGGALAISRGPAVELWDLETGRRTATLSGGGGRLAHTADGSYLISGDGVIWDLEAGTRSVSYEAPAGAVAAHPDGDLFINADGGLRSLQSGERLATLFDLRTPAVEILFAGDTLVWVADDGRIYVWGVPGDSGSVPLDISTRAITPSAVTQLALLDHFGRGRLEQAVWSPNGEYLAINTSENTLLYNPLNLQLIDAYLGAKTLAFDEAGNALIGGEAPLQLIEPGSGAVVKDFELIGITAGAFSPDERELAIGGAIREGAADGLAVIDLTDGLLREIDLGHDAYREVTALEFTPDGTYLVQSLPGAIQIWEVDRGSLLRQPIRGNTGPAAISPDGQHLAYLTNRFIVEDLKAGGQYRAINADGTPYFPTGLDYPSLRPLDYSFGADGRLNIFYSALNRRTFDEDVRQVAWNIHDSPVTGEIEIPQLIRLSELSGRYAAEYLEQRPQLVPSMWPDEKGQQLASLTSDGVVRVWSAGSGELLAESGTDLLSLMALSPSGDSLAIPNALGEVQIINPTTGRVTRAHSEMGYPEWIDYNSESVVMLAYNDGNAAFIDAGTGAVLDSYDLSAYSSAEYLVPDREGQVLATLEMLGGQNRLQLLALSPNGPLLELDRYPLPAVPAISPSGSLLGMPRRGEVEIWDLQTNSLIMSLPGSAGVVGYLAFTPDESRLITAGGEIWELESGERSGALENADPTSRIITNGSIVLNQLGAVWSLEGGSPIGQLSTEPAVDFIFSPDGSRVFWQRQDGIVEVWGVGSD